MHQTNIDRFVVPAGVKVSVAVDSGRFGTRAGLEVRADGDDLFAPRRRLL